MYFKLIYISEMETQDFEEHSDDDIKSTDTTEGEKHIQIKTSFFWFTTYILHIFLAKCCKTSSKNKNENDNDDTYEVKSFCYFLLKISLASVFQFRDNFYCLQKRTQHLLNSVPLRRRPREQVKR